MENKKEMIVLCLTKKKTKDLIDLKDNIIYVKRSDIKLSDNKIIYLATIFSDKVIKILYKCHVVDLKMINIDEMTKMVIERSMVEKNQKYYINLFKVLLEYRKKKLNEGNKVTDKTSKVKDHETLALIVEDIKDFEYCLGWNDITTLNIINAVDI